MSGEDDVIATLEEINRLLRWKVRLLTTSEWLDNNYLLICGTAFVLSMLVDGPHVVIVYLAICCAAVILPGILSRWADRLGKRANALKNQQVVVI